MEHVTFEIWSYHIDIWYAIKYTKYSTFSDFIQQTLLYSKNSNINRPIKRMSVVV